MTYPPPPPHDPFQQPYQQFPQPQPSATPKILTMILSLIALVALAGAGISLRVVSSLGEVEKIGGGLSKTADGRLVSAGEIARLTLAALEMTLASMAILALAAIQIFLRTPTARNPLRIALTAAGIFSPLIAIALYPTWGGGIYVLVGIPLAILIALLWIIPAAKAYFAVNSPAPVHFQGQQPDQTGFYPGAGGNFSSQSGPGVDPQQPQF